MVEANTQNCSKTPANEIGRYNFETADSFTYIGSLVNGENVSEETTNRLIAANRSYFGLKGQFVTANFQEEQKYYIQHLCGQYLHNLHTPQKPGLRQKMMKTAYLRKENPSHNIWSDMRGTAVVEEIRQKIRIALQRTKYS